MVNCIFPFPKLMVLCCISFLIVKACVCPLCEKQNRGKTRMYARTAVLFIDFMIGIRGVLSVPSIKLQEEFLTGFCHPIRRSYVELLLSTVNHLAKRDSGCF